MDLGEFAESQKQSFVYTPKFRKDGIDKFDHGSSPVPFVKLFEGKESDESVLSRWMLYNKLHADFHATVDDILASIDKEVVSSISNTIQELIEPASTRAKSYAQTKQFKTLILLGSDVDTNIELPEDTPDYYNVFVDLEPKDAPNVRLLLKRVIFKMLEAMELKLQEQANASGTDDTGIEYDEDVARSLRLYDMLVFEMFQPTFKRKLNLIINFKETETFFMNVFQEFIDLMKSTLNIDGMQVCFIFNLATNVEKFENNLDQSTVRAISSEVRTVDLSNTKGYKYSNMIFQSFLDCVDRKLNLSPKFVKFILDKMDNNTNQNLQLLLKILDYSLMAYFFNNPYSIFIDVANISFLDSKYLDRLTKCQTFLDFVENMVNSKADAEDILSLLSNENNALEEFFVDFLVAENPINDKLHQIIDILENKLHIYDYNLIDLYYHMLNNRLIDYLEKWESCKEYKDEFDFENIQIVFQELFTLDNNNGLLSQGLFPFFRTNLEDNLLNCERVLPRTKAIQMMSNSKIEFTDLEVKLNELITPIISQVFALYREASFFINVYDFFTAFKESLPKAEIYELLKTALASEEVQTSVKSKSQKILEQLSEEEFMDRLALVWFIKGLTECQYLGILKTQRYKTYEVVEKIIWRGI
ncbi:origin recognition complex subunit 3 [Kluyveromyces marxianus]|uniref:Origin recognition complex subunit 3 n=1 Tax=Kluyveromyces marxianus (strain DMKU3-1042 / BCC 29191 / NBRC 104275) TaxID=1003335 RepID=W0T681_KLUMD|nr:origin recognition complex subunit 3 [Kluyveromyces marxianus DMKU3-1042]BAO38573.1 origin recognition complex subunit 3 [Kluyveromyces marxianus DMKU3-1042]BAP70122.1 origin recognition complex subunit 3 [Kluyveromyces marxianus]